jgi:twitching motility protein PilT
MEVLLVTPVVREILLNPARLTELPTAIADGNANDGMQTFEQHLDQLAKDGVIDADAAAAAKGRRLSVEVIAKARKER